MLEDRNNQGINHDDIVINGSLEQKNGGEETESGLRAESSLFEFRWIRPFPFISVQYVKYAKKYARYAKYANVIFNMQNMHRPLC